MLIRRIAALALALACMLGAAPSDRPQGTFVFSDRPAGYDFAARRGLMTLSGEVVLPAGHGNIYPLSDDDAGAPQIFIAEVMVDAEQGRVYTQTLYDARGKKLTRKDYGSYTALLGCGYIAAYLGRNESLRMDILSTEGEILLEGLPYSAVVEGPNGYIAWSPENAGGVEAGFFDKAWKEIARRRVESIEPYNPPREGAWLIPFKESGKWGYVNESGATAIEPVYDKTERFQANGYGLVSQGNKRALIDASGQVVTEYADAWHDGWNPHFAILSSDYATALLRADDLTEIASGYDAFTTYSSYNYSTRERDPVHGEWAAGRRKAGGYDLFHVSGRKIALPDAENVTLGLRHAIITPQAGAGGAVNTLLNLETGGEVPLGKGRGNFQYEANRIIMWEEEAHNRLYDLGGNLLASYPVMELYGNGGLYLVEVRRFGQNRTGLIDRDGNVLLKPEFSFLSYQSAGGGVLEVRRGDEKGYMTMDGTWIHKQNVYNRLED